ncbi:unnamed protein product [Notodromas monacha]|uniref:Uncharacterized protein n=1 Tax=Notodromas monacha TaxID=399045 RepID=A0A7R9C0F7_9CRUS|nr:unnamed protein product [Notodromas monacha]CAG0923858.1 unnamed protein product [Notodromas monacha]
MESSAKVNPDGNHSGRVEKKGATSMGKEATGKSSGMEKEMKSYGSEPIDDTDSDDESDISFNYYEFERRFVTREEYEETYGNGWKDSSSSVHENETESNEDESPENTSSFEDAKKPDDNVSVVECSGLLYDILESPGIYRNWEKTKRHPLGMKLEDTSPVKQLHAESNGEKNLEGRNTLRSGMHSYFEISGLCQKSSTKHSKTGNAVSLFTFFCTPVEHVKKKRRRVVDNHWALTLSIFSTFNKMLSHVLRVLRLHLKSCRETSMFQDKSRQVMAMKEQVWASFRSVEAQIYHSPYLKPWEKDSHRQDADQRMNEEIRRVSFPDDGIG